MATGKHRTRRDMALSCNNIETEILMSMSSNIRGFAGEQGSKLLRRLAFEITRTLKSCDPERVHDLRVAIRRFNQLLRVLKPCFLGKEMRKIRRQLKTIMNSAGEVRNCDIALKLLSKAAGGEEVNLSLKIKDQRRLRERELRGLLRPWMDRKSSSKWRAALGPALANMEQTLAEEPIESTAQRELPRMARDFFKKGKRAAGTKASIEELHQFRISAKKFRYTLELLDCVCDDSLVRLQEPMKRTQTLLGDINDIATLQQMVLGHKGAHAVEQWLEKRQQKRIDEFRRYWKEQFGAPETATEWIERLSHPAAESRILKKPVKSGGTTLRAQWAVA
jgi:CHAD domain-containing protein